MKFLTFSKRVFTEILRDPVSYVFGLAFPIVMLVLMTVINKSVPPEANMQLFQIQNLSCGIATFGFSFIMLLGSMLVSKDKSGAFLTRLYTSPMRSIDFILGYAIPLLALAILQMLITFIASFVIAEVVGAELSVTSALLAMATLLPFAVCMVFLGIALGFLLNDKSAPPVTSIGISLSGMLGGVWFDPTGVDAFYAVCRALPFLNATEASRYCFSLEYSNIPVPLLITAMYMLLSVALSVVFFKMHRRTK